MYKNYFKRLLDIVFSVIGIIVFFPIYLLVAIMVRINLGSPIIFKQKRPGKDEKIFTMYKFRSMSDKKDKNGNLLSDKDRLTKFGRVLRATSLDELPELFNILKGDMSIVGPRPLAIVYLEYYNEEEKKRHSVKPGLTGLAQINGRNLSNWDERFKNDIEYVENISFANDFKIILKTIKKVLLKEDVVARGEGKTLDFHIYRQQQLEENNKLKRY
ncbi:sugar transferase [Clostridium perfringens]|nr:sugar transferase [Clostridium perfringens]